MYRLIRVQETHFLLPPPPVWRELSRSRGCHDGWDGLKISPKTLSIKSDATSNCEEAHHFVAVRFFGLFRRGGPNIKVILTSFGSYSRGLSLSVTQLIIRRRRKNLTDFRHDPANTSAPFVRRPKSPPASCFSTIRSTFSSSSSFARLCLSVSHLILSPCCN